MDKPSWQFYTSSKEAWDAMLHAISFANESIELEQFILNYDSIGIMFLEALKERAALGVKVRIFCDEVGSFSLYRSGIADELKEHGIEIKFFNSVLPWSPNKESLWFFRDHKKLLIIDKKIGFTGGVCLGDEMREWRESSVRIEGKVVLKMHEAFEVMWNKSYHHFRFFLKKKSGNSFNSENFYPFNYITNAPLPGKRYMYRELIRAIVGARHYIYLTTPYLLPDYRLMRCLKRAAKRNVEVRILVPFTTNSRLVNIGAGTFFNAFLEAGIKIYRYNGSMIHSKTGVIDGNWATIGSLNLDNLSLRYNFEGNLVSTDKKFAFELEREFLNDLKLSSLLTKSDWDKRGIIRKILEILVWPLRKLL